ncbi:hypothetical protein [Allosphingosinicella sp.]|jgi:hypothetical protein|uniref:hypothetical protein n=1 Tax=Allosphingosinicella sp. TaxID=2823234 RepID=UPI002F25377A
MSNPASFLPSLALAGLLSACATSGVPAPGSHALIVADVAMSEWIPPGQMTLDLRTGRYEIVPAPPRSGARPAPRGRTRRGALAPAPLAQARRAWHSALSEGLEHTRCRSGGPPPRIVVSNAGTPRMVLAGSDRTVSAPGQMGCWSASAERLHTLLETLFDSEARGWE